MKGHDQTDTTTVQEAEQKSKKGRSETDLPIGCRLKTVSVDHHQ